MEDSMLWFEDFLVDLGNERVWRGHEALPLTPKAFAILRHLLAHPGQLVTKAALFQAVWPETAVGDAVLTVGIGEIRKALGDDPQSPRFIETVHRRGYRFIAPLRFAPLVSRMRPLASDPESTPATISTERRDRSNRELRTAIVGRDEEMTQIHNLLNKAFDGERQFVFVTGEPGIGKTTVVDAFLEQVAARNRCWIGQGQCIEHYGVGEAYLPVFMALGQLCRAAGGQRLREILSHYAPTWLAQMPALLDAAILDLLQLKTQGTTRERMLREMAEAVEAFTAEHPVVLVLEDLHWSDAATLDLLSFIARRRQPARLLVLGTYRPADITVREHPLRTLSHDLQTRQQCIEISLGRLPAAAVEEYLAVTFPVHRLPAMLAQTLHQRTSGIPLFLTTVVQDWTSHGVLVEVAGRWELHQTIDKVADTVPSSLRQLIERQLAALSVHDQQVLEAASVVGDEFSAAIVAAGVGEEVGSVEERCESLMRREQVLEARGAAEWPDGTIAARYGFSHALYQQVLYEQVPAGRQAWLHRHVGQRLEAAYGARVDEISAELAMHFERGREYVRAVRYLEQAAQRALRRSAPREAIQHLSAALRVLRTLPETRENAQKELALQTRLGLALTIIKGHAAQEVEQAYGRAHALCQHVGETHEVFPVLFGLWTFRLMRAEYRAASELCRQLLGVAERMRDAGLLLEARAAMGVTFLYLGEFSAARVQLEQSLALYEPQQHRSHVLLYGQDPGAATRAYLALVLWFLGYPDQALQQSQEAIAHARKLTHPFSLAFVLGLGGILHNCRREPETYQERAEEVIALASEYELSHWLAQGIIGRGRALIQQGMAKEGAEQIQQVVETWRKEGKALGRPTAFAALAEAYGAMGQMGHGLKLLAEALTTIDRSGERWWEVEVHRLKGALLVQTGAWKETEKSWRLREAEACFRQALEVARRQNTKILELRAATSMARLWRQQSKTTEARRLLAESYNWFTEGFDTKDLQEAKALLTELS